MLLTAFGADRLGNQSLFAANAYDDEAKEKARQKANLPRSIERASKEAVDAFVAQRFAPIRVVLD